MKEQADFFRQLEAHFNAKLPFVAFRKPNELAVDVLLQRDDELLQVGKTNKSGFVFCSFSGKKKVLIPIDRSTRLSCNFKIDSTNSSVNQSLLIEDDDSKKDHIQLVLKAISEIQKGGLDKVVLSRKQDILIGDDCPFELYRNLLNMYPSAFCYLWYHPKVGMWLGASPETFIKYENKILTTMSLAGTKPLVENEEINWGSKEKDEQQLVTDYIVNQLKAVCAPDCILKTDGVHTVHAGNIGHLKTTISLKLSDEKLLDPILNALHPTPAVAGLPTNKAIDFINENENYDRDFYTGYLGEIVDDTISLFVNLRCMQLDEKKAFVYIGGGITRASIAEKEWEETVHKSKTMMNILTKL